MQLFINETFEIDGKVVIRNYEESEQILSEGTLEIDFYIFDLKEIQTDKFLVVGIEVISEMYDSEKDSYFYEFRADRVLFLNPIDQKGE